MIARKPQKAKSAAYTHSPQTAKRKNSKKAATSATSHKHKHKHTAQARPPHFERATHEQQTSGRRSLISQIKYKPESWTTAAAIFFPTLRAPD
jgi:hypothetical protein